MRYFFIHRALPGPDFKYPDNVKPWEKLSRQDIRNIKYSGKPIKVEHEGGEIGKVLFEWHAKDDSKIALSYVDDNTFEGKTAISKIKNGTYSFTSPLYDVGIVTGPDFILIDKAYAEISLTDKPDFDNHGGCNIFFGASEDDLNIKSQDFLKNSFNTEYTLFSKEKHTTSDKKISDFQKFLENLTMASNQANNTVPPTAVDQAKQAEVLQQQNNTQLNTEVQDPQKPATGSLKSIQEMAVQVATNPKVLEGVAENIIRDGFFLLAKEYDSLAKGPGKRLAEDNLEASKKSRVDEAPVNIVIGANGQQMRTIPENEYQALVSNTKGSMDRVFTNLKSNLDQVGSIPGSLPGFDTEKAKGEIDSIRQIATQYPHSDLASKITQVADTFGTYVMAHRNGYFQNEQTRKAVLEAQTRVGSEHLKNFIKEQTHPQPVTTQVRYGEYTQTNQKSQVTPSKDTYMEQLTKNVLGRISNNYNSKTSGFASDIVSKCDTF